MSQTRVSNATAFTNPKSTDLLLGASYTTESSSGTNYETASITVGNLTKTLSSNNFSVTKNDTPANSASTTGLTVGQMWCDVDYLYVVTSNTVIKRVALSTF